MELTAAVLSVKIASLVKKELNLGEVTEYFWTDSNIVLGYIINNTRRFKTFVANRVHQIKENTDNDQWRYVPTKWNPADDASRGLNAEKESSDSRWFNGPSFLWQDTEYWPDQEDIIQVAEHDPELKKEVKTCAAVVQKNFVQQLEERISCWSKMKGVVALVLCYKEKLQERIKKKQPIEENGESSNKDKSLQS